MEAQVQTLRRPLQPKNIEWDPKPKPKLVKIEGSAGKENRPFEGIGPLEVSLAEELRVVRRRRARLRLEREQTERLLRERERVLDMGCREMEMRWEEQKKVELEIQRIVWFMDLRSCVVRENPCI